MLKIVRKDTKDYLQDKKIKTIKYSPKTVTIIIPTKTSTTESESVNHG